MAAVCREAKRAETLLNEGFRRGAEAVRRRVSSASEANSNANANGGNANGSVGGSGRSRWGWKWRAGPLAL